MVTDKSLIAATQPLSRFPHLMHCRASPCGFIRSFHKFIGLVPKAFGTNLKICFVLTTKHLSSPFVNILKQLQKKLPLNHIRLRSSPHTMRTPIKFLYPISNPPFLPQKILQAAFVGKFIIRFF